MMIIENLIQYLYSNLLSREASATEVQAWSNQLSSGDIDLKTMIDGVGYSAESINLGNSPKDIQNIVCKYALGEEEFSYSDEKILSAYDQEKNIFSVYTAGYILHFNLSKGGRMEGMGIVASVSHSTGESDSSSNGYVNDGEVIDIKYTEGSKCFHELSFTAKLYHQGNGKWYGHLMKNEYKFYPSHIELKYSFSVERQTGEELFYMWDSALDVEDTFTHYLVRANIYRPNGEGALYLLHPQTILALGVDWLNREIPEFETYPWTGGEISEVAKNAGISAMASDLISPYLMLYAPNGPAILRRKFYGFEKVSVYSNPKFSETQSMTLELFHTNGYFMDQDGINRPYEGDGINLALRNIDNLKRECFEEIWFGTSNAQGVFSPNYIGSGPNRY